MAIRNIDFAALRDGENVTLKLREGESVIVGTVGAVTARGGRKIHLVNNANSVVIYDTTNFRIFAERGRTVGEVLDAEPIGSVFTFRNKYGVTKTWVKSGDDRVTLVDNTRPAHSLSISAGFPADEEAGDRIEFLDEDY